MELSKKQQRQVDALSRLLTTPNKDTIVQGIELATALDDEVVFDKLLDGVRSGPPPQDVPPARRFPTLERGTLFEGAKENQSWLDLAMVHLVAASSSSLRAGVTSIALEARRVRGSKRRPKLWLDGLERLPSLTHLDLLVSDGGVDLAPLAAFPSLTHLRLRGRSGPLLLPALDHLEVFNGGEVEFAPGSRFASLRSFRGRIRSNDPISPELMPSLVDVETLGPAKIYGFESLGKLACNRGPVEVLDCTQVEQLRVSAPVFEAPHLRHVGMIDQVGNIDVSQFETVGGVRMNRTTRFSGGTFPKGAKLLSPRVILWGPTLTSLGNIGELSGLEVLSMLRTKQPVSLETLRHAADLRMLDIRNSPGITDLSPLIGLPKLETIVLSARDTQPIPPELVGVVKRGGGRAQRNQKGGVQASTGAPAGPITKANRGEI